MLSDAGETAKQRVAPQHALLTTAYNLLHQRWQQLDPAWQATFWQNVPSHQRLKELVEGG